VLNSLNNPGAGFEKDTNQVSLIHPTGMVELSLKSKNEIADEIVAYLVTKIDAHE